ncbi:MAG: hypothetical protein HYT94_04805 [Parcubacteria group bacterium]|nr:hypothetical protein [Parcubacteria group bacterium]
MKNEIEKVKLKIQESKTEIRIFHEAQGKIFCANINGNPSKLQYLGVEFNGVKTLLRHKGYAKFERKMIGKIRQEVIVGKKNKTPLSKKRIYEKYSPLGKMNYPSYAKSASRSLGSGEIGRQVGSQRIMKNIKKRIKSEILRSENFS